MFYFYKIKIMREYELFYLIGESDKAEFAAINTQVQEIVTKHGGTWLPKQVTEERRLAYPIKHQRRGLYVAQRFTLPDKDERDEQSIADANPIAHVTRDLNLHKQILRAIIVDAAELPALMTKEEKEAAKIVEKQKKEIAQDKKTDGETIDQQLQEALNI
jgi:ribosomal protein S6